MMNRFKKIARYSIIVAAILMIGLLILPMRILVR